MATITHRHSFPALNHIVTDHTPYNMKPWQGREKQAVANLDVVYYDGTGKREEPWLEIKTEELTTDKNGRVSSKTISIHLHGEDVAKLRQLLNGCFEGTFPKR